MATPQCVILIVVRTDDNFSENGSEQDEAQRSWYSSSGEDNEQLRRRNSSSDGALGCQATDEEQQSGRYRSTVQGLHDPVAKARMIPCSVKEAA